MDFLSCGTAVVGQTAIPRSKPIQALHQLLHPCLSEHNPLPHPITRSDMLATCLFGLPTKAQTGSHQRPKLSFVTSKRSLTLFHPLFSLLTKLLGPHLSLACFRGVGWLRWLQRMKHRLGLSVAVRVGLVEWYRANAFHCRLFIRSFC